MLVSWLGSVENAHYNNCYSSPFLYIAIHSELSILILPWVDCCEYEQYEDLIWACSLNMFYTQIAIRHFIILCFDLCTLFLLRRYPEFLVTTQKHYEYHFFLISIIVTVGSACFADLNNQRPGLVSWWVVREKINAPHVQLSFVVFAPLFIDWAVSVLHCADACLLTHCDTSWQAGCHTFVVAHACMFNSCHT